MPRAIKTSLQYIFIFLTNRLEMQLKELLNNTKPCLTLHFSKHLQGLKYCESQSTFVVTKR